MPHKGALEALLKDCLGTLFAEPFDILMYDLTSTYFEGLAEGIPSARRGYSRNHRGDCVQIVIGLVVTRSGLPLGYEVFAGNQAEPATLDKMMAKMEQLYGKASRIWVFDRGVASERNLEALRGRGGLYLVGTPRTLLRNVEAALLEDNWKTVREGIDVKLVAAPDPQPRHLHPVPLRGSSSKGSRNSRPFRETDRGTPRSNQGCGRVRPPQES